MTMLTIDPSKPRSRRPLMGYDIEQWRGEMSLSKFEAQSALGFRNANHYNKICLLEIIPVSIEIIIRLYLEFPKARGWKKFSLQELFNLMYGEQLALFEGRPDYTAAKVDLGNRFTRLFDRSSSRKYNWLRDDSGSSGGREFGGAYSDVETILAILKEVPDPKEVFERVACQVFTLRGVDIENEHRIPTLELPPVRRKTGRKATRPPVNRLARVSRAEVTGKAVKAPKATRTPKGSKAITAPKAPKGSKALKAPKAPKAPRAVKTSLPVEDEKVDEAVQ